MRSFVRLSALALLVGAGSAAPAALHAQRPDSATSAPSAQSPGLPEVPPELRREAEARFGPGVTQAELMERIRQSGLSRDQIRSRLQQMGYSPDLADSYFDMIEQGAQPSGAPISAEFLSALRRMGVPVGDSAAAGDTLETDTLHMLDVPPDTIFGQNLFLHMSSQFTPNQIGPVPPDYRLGPGDQLMLILTGDIELVHTLDVLPEGYIVIPDVGQVFVSGLTLAELEDRLYERLGYVYSGVQRGAGATTHFQVSMGRLRMNQVYVIGEVRRPGAYQISAAGTVFAALYHAGGPNEDGSFRQVEVKRGGRVVATVDIYDYLLRGGGSSDVRLQNGDIVFVPIAGPRVRIEGAVRRPLIYELAPADDVADLVLYAGGFRADALVKRVQIDRILPPSQRRPGVDRVLMDVDLASLEPGAEALALRDGDRVQVFGVADERRHRVMVAGEVRRPGTYEWADGMTLWRLVDNAGGLDEDAYTPRAHIYRRNTIDGGRSLVRTPLLADAEGNALRDIVLADQDSVVIYSRADLKNSELVTIDGFVKKPGSYTLSEGMSLKDLILAAGGFSHGAYVLEAEVARQPDPLVRTRTTAEVISVPLVDAETRGALDGENFQYAAGLGGQPAAAAGSALPAPGAIPVWVPDSEEFHLRHGDRVFVRKAPGYESTRTVLLTGEVELPGTYVLRTRDERLTDVLERAGGFTAEANPSGLRVTRAGNMVATEIQEALAKPESRHNLALEAGDSIHVPPNDPTVLVQGAVAFESRVLYRPGAGLGYYIEQSGGYLESGDEDRVTVMYPNGERRSMGGFLFFDMAPKLEPGSTILVPEKSPADMRGVDWGAVIKDTLGIATTALTVLLLARRLDEQ